MVSVYDLICKKINKISIYILIKNKTYQYMAFFGVELNAQANRLYGQIKLTLNKNNYLPNFRTIYRSMAKFDPEQSGYVTLTQFDKALQ